MLVFRNINEIPYLPGTVVTDGMFDGLHLGHQKILHQVCRQASGLGLPSVLLTYWPHPRLVLNSGATDLFLLTSLEEKIRLAGELGIDIMVIIPFSIEFSQMSHSDFVRNILCKTLNTRQLIVGYDHRFGKDRLGDITFLRNAGAELGFGLTEIGKQDVEDLAISSTRIRKFLEGGQPENARKLLGRPYSIQGTIIKGQQRGRSIGFPTANLSVEDEHKLIPQNGVYVSRCRINGQWHPSMTNIGFRPTFQGMERSIETHLLNFQADLYGQEAEVALLSKLREELKFSGPEALKDQLEKDRDKALALHRREAITDSPEV